MFLKGAGFRVCVRTLILLAQMPLSESWLKKEVFRVSEEAEEPVS
jgi:hypothetical protein